MTYAPKDFPKWESVYYYYHKWASPEEFDLLLECLCGNVRLHRNQNMESNVGIMDSQSVKWGDNRSLCGIDRNKKVKGIKRHMIVSKNGFLVAVIVTMVYILDRMVCSW